MKLFSLIVVVAFLGIACHRELGEVYLVSVPNRYQPVSGGFYGAFEFDKADSTFVKYISSGSDTLYGSYSIVGNQLYLTELSSAFRCDSNRQGNSIAFTFYYEFDSLPVINYPVEINGQFYYTDSFGVLKNFNNSGSANYILVKPVLMKAFRIPLDCTHAFFYMEPKQVNNPDFLEYTIRKNSIRSKDGYKYKKVKQ
jgi:hypothetical protein